MARRLLERYLVDRAVIATATELLAARHYPGVIAVCSDALEHEPECIPLLVTRARAHIALRRELDAQADLRDIIRLDPRCAIAYRLLGELAARRDENEPAAIFFREALRLDPDDRHARDWLQIVEASARPAAVAPQLPASAAAAGRFRPVREPARPVPSMVVHIPPREASAPARGVHQEPPAPRFAHGTRPPAYDDRASRPVEWGAPRHARMWHVATMTPAARPAPTVAMTSALPPPPPMQGAQEPAPVIRIPPRGEPASSAPSRAIARAAVPELPGFGEYLVSVGILTLQRLRAAQAYQRAANVELSTAIVALGLATPQRIAWAAVTHRTTLAPVAAAR